MRFSLSEPFKQAQLIPVIEFSDITQVVPLLDILSEHHFKVIEITLRHPCAYEALKIAIEHYPQLIIGAGSVMTTEQLFKLSAMNIQFAVSPGSSVNLLAHNKQAFFPLIPGIMTPSDILLGMEQGIKVFKFFPAEAAGGISLLKSLAGPFKDIQFCPTGGIRLDNVKNYLALPNVLCVGASWFVTAQDLAEQNWSKIRALTKEARSILNS